MLTIIDKKKKHFFLFVIFNLLQHVNRSLTIFFIIAKMLIRYKQNYRTVMHKSDLYYYQ